MRRNERFSRETLAGYDRKVVQDTHVVLVGVGALGGFIAQTLALLGFPKVVFVDMDKFEDSNAPRSPFFQCGMQKAKAVARGAQKLCTAPGAIDYHYAVKRIQAVGDVLFQAKSTAMICAVDCIRTRLWLAQRARKLGILLVEGGFQGSRWNASVILNSKNDGPCWACGQRFDGSARIFSCDAYARRVEQAGLVPASAPVAMHLASLMVDLMSQAIHGKHTLTNSTVFGDMRHGASHVMHRVLDSQCRVDHRVIDGDPVALECGPKDSVVSLLTEIESRMNEPIIHLPAAFVHSAPCLKCRETTRVLLPEWQLDGPPQCTGCRGSFERQDGIPQQHGFLSGPTSGSLLDLSLETLGLGPGLCLDVEGSSEQFTVALSAKTDGWLTSV